jgi:hypothetical protein
MGTLVKSQTLESFGIRRVIVTPPGGVEVCESKEAGGDGCPGAPPSIFRVGLAVEFLFHRVKEYKAKWKARAS